MATYYFECTECDSNASVSISITEEAQAPKCLSCDVYMVRVFSAPGITFKGTGWGSDR